MKKLVIKNIGEIVSGDIEKGVLEGDTVVAEEGLTVIDVFADVLQRDGDVLSVSAVIKPADGTVTIEANRPITCTPDSQFSGADSFGASA